MEEKHKRPILKRLWNGIALKNIKLHRIGAWSFEYSVAQYNLFKTKCETYTAN